MGRSLPFRSSTISRTPGPPSDWYFLVGWNRQRLACIFLWPPQQATVLCPEAIEAFDDQRATVAEIRNLGGGSRHAESGEQLQAEIFVFDAVRQVDAVRQRADLRFQDMGGGGGARGFEPPSVLAQQCGFFLCACDRDPEVYILAHAQRGRCEVLDDVRDVVVRDRFAVGAADGTGIDAVRQKLERANTVMAQGGQQAVGIRALCANAFRDTLSDRIAVGQQVIEDIDDRRTDIAILAQWQRQRNREGRVPREPVGFIPEVDRACSLPPQHANKTAIQENIQRDVRPLPSHQNRSSMSAALPWLRGLTTSSRLRAERASIRVCNCTAGSPASSRETVPCRRWICSPKAPCVSPACLAGPAQDSAKLFFRSGNLFGHLSLRK